MMELGFIGLGVMGTPMATHLANAGHRMTLFDINPAIAEGLAARLGEHAMSVASPREVAEQSDVIITMLPNGEVVRKSVLGDQGLLEGLREDAILLDCSSAQPWLTIETAALLAERGGRMVDAPVSGAQWGAENAELVFMVGGREEDVARIRPLLEVMGKQIFHLGDLASGHAMKCINNCITASTLTATAEGLVLGKRFGLDPELMVDVLNVSTGGSWISQTHFKKRIFSRAFDDPFKLELMLKDIGISVDLAKATKTPTPVAALTQQLWMMADQQAGPAASISELVRWVESLSMTPLTPGSLRRNDTA